MNYDITFRVLGIVLNRIVKQEIPERSVLRDLKQEYKSIVRRASEIGAHNPLLGAYGLAAYFIAMNRKDGFCPERNCDILEEGLRHCKALPLVMGSADRYFSEAHRESCRKWSQETHQRRYKNDWVVDVIETGDEFAFGFDYYECGVCKLCQQEGCPELAKYLCRLDGMITDVMGIHLERTMTLAEGFPKCDFRFRRM